MRVESSFVFKIGGVLLKAELPELDCQSGCSRFEELNYGERLNDWDIKLWW